MAVTSSPADSNGKEVVEKSQAKCPGVRVVGGRIYDSQNGKTCHQVMSDSFDRILMISGPFFFVFFLLPVWLMRTCKKMKETSISSFSSFFILGLIEREPMNLLFMISSLIEL
jgi:hypothetical protein